MGLSIGNGVQVAFTVPVRKRVKHVWTYWGAITGHDETGACSAAIGGRDPIRFGLSWVVRHPRWLERGSVRCSRVGFPGGVVLTVGTAARPRPRLQGWLTMVCN